MVLSKQAYWSRGNNRLNASLLRLEISSALKMTKALGLRHSSYDRRSLYTGFSHTHTQDYGRLLRHLRNEEMMVANTHKHHDDFNDNPSHLHLGVSTIFSAIRTRIRWCLFLSFSPFIPLARRTQAFKRYWWLSIWLSLYPYITPKHR